ncbi:MAG: DUF502 domain-containing protein [Planctomycetota bacterium]
MGTQTTEQRVAPGKNETTPPLKKAALDPFRRAVLRGFGVLLPPLLTLVIFLWVGNTVARSVLEPLVDGARYLLVEYASDIRTADEVPEGAEARGEFVEVESGKTPRFIPTPVYDRVAEKLDDQPMPETAKGIYGAYVEERWLQRRFVIPIFLCVFVLVLYLLGKFLAAGIGRFFWNRFELLIDRVPLVRNVYSSVKQVTDFLFTDPDLENNFTRVVAVEYPRKGIWTVAFMTGESMLDIETAANEPVMTVLIPTSPMPFTGFTITVKKSESIDLDITVEQAFQFIVSCGVVVPPQQLTQAVAARNAELAAAGLADAKQRGSSNGPGIDGAGVEASPALAARTSLDQDGR